MTISTVTLYSNTSNTFPTGSPGTDVTTAALAGTPIVSSIGKAYTQKWFWVKLVDAFNNETTAALGSYRTTDTTPPTITTTVAAGTPSSTSIDLTYTVADNSDQLSELYVSASTTSPANAAAIRAIGVQKTAAVMSGATHTFSSLTASTTYYISVLATDAAGNSTIETKSLATAAAGATPLYTIPNMTVATTADAKTLDSVSGLPTLIQGTTWSLSLFAKYTTAANNRILWFRRPDANAHLGFGFATPPTISLMNAGNTTNSGTLDANWHHYVITCSNDMATFYVDNVQKLSGSTTVSPYTLSQLSGANMYLGCGASGGVKNNPFIGNINKIRFYNTVLTTTEIQALYDEGAV
jgi:hypothetical protein